MSQEKAHRLDNKDELASAKRLFALPDNTIYLDGNSLGPPLKSTQKLLQECVEKEWGERLIRSWNEKWLERQQNVSASIAKLINAKPHEVIVSDSVSVNFYKLIMGWVLGQKETKSLLTDDLNFPSDIYVLDQVAKNTTNQTNLEILVQSGDIEYSESILAALNNQIGLLTLSHVTFKDAYRYDEIRINKKCRELGIVNLWDLSHSIGSVEIDVKKQQMDMAVGCTYKFLNGGPGAPAFVYISEDMQAKIQNPIAGWFSHRNPFDFDIKYEPHFNANKFLVGTSPILSLTGITEGIELFNQIGMKKIVAKREQMLTFFIDLYSKNLETLGFSLHVPKRHGSHLALKHAEAYRINLSLINPLNKQAVIITDHRPPNIIRIALTPLYVSFMDLYTTVERLVEIVRTNEYKRHSKDKSGVI